VLVQALLDDRLVLDVPRWRGDQQPELGDLVAAIAHRAAGLGQEVLGQRAPAIGARIEVREDIVVVVQPETHGAGRRGGPVRGFAAGGPTGGPPSPGRRLLGGHLAFAASPLSHARVASPFGGAASSRTQMALRSREDTGPAEPSSPASL